MLYRVETRHLARSAPLDLAAALRDRRDVQRALEEFRDGPLRDPGRSMLGETQERWLFDRFRARDGVRWQVLAQQTVMGDLRAPQGTENWLPPDAPDSLRQRARIGAAAAKLGLPFNFDAWGGFPASRDRLLTAALEGDADLVVLSGDSHNAWGQDLSAGGRPAGVEFAGQSVTSPGFEAYLRGVTPTDLAKIVRAENTGLAFCDTARRGYVSVMLTPESATGAWHFLETIREPSTRLAETRRFVAARGERRLREA